ncbi:DUF4331 family protein [Streptomyces sp. NPDC015680]|uniref:DUF4331 family protein n=1 Tax=Streptomyces sp. NPDC015680 TaxID=3364962 RepID=UPI0036FF37F7
MSHHLDTPQAAKNGQLFIGDLYVFPGEHGTVLVMDLNSNVTGVHQRRGFHPEARYEFKIHANGAEFEELTYRVSFGEPDADGGQALRQDVLTGQDAREDSAAGKLALEGHTGETVTDSATRLWAGRVQDPFYMDLPCWPSPTVRSRRGLPSTCRAGIRRRRRTPSPAPRWTPSRWRFLTATTAWPCGIVGPRVDGWFMSRTPAEAVARLPHR